MAKQQANRPVLYRAVKFELHLTHEQEALLMRISDSLREIWNWALELRVKAYEEYKNEKAEGKKPQTKLPKLFDQINLLTELRADAERKSLFGARVPRNWQEETLDTLDGAFKSFFALVKNGDADARPPWMRREQYFNEIPGRSGFSLKEGKLIFAPNLFGKEMLSFPVPEYCKQLLAKGERVKKFTLFRDESLLKEPGRYWVSLVYEMTKPEPQAFESDKAVWLAVGATWLGVLSPDGEKVIKLWRPDTYWKPHIDSVEARFTPQKNNAHQEQMLKKGSRKWHRRMKARREMFRRMSAQQKQNHREVVRRLLKLGVHFVVQDLTIRGGLADSSKPERRELNWAVQNTGSIGELLRHLDEKAKEYGGYVIKHEPSLPPTSGHGKNNKLSMAKRLQEDYLQSRSAVS